MRSAALTAASTFHETVSRAGIVPVDSWATSIPTLMADRRPPTGAAAPERPVVIRA
jgi:hypothetical protein